MEQSSLAYLVWLVALMSPANRNTLPLIEYFGSVEAVFAATESQLRQCGLLSPDLIQKLLNNKTLTTIEPILGYCEKNDVWMTTYWDEDYPENFKTMDDPPVLLFCKGEPVWRDSILQIAVAGTRNMTVYGRRMAEQITADLAEIGCTIIGGMSDGIDATAHRAALGSKGKTVAILPGGIDVIYPNSQYNLYWQIAENGCVISEFLPGTPPLGGNFQPRNRLIAGMANGVLHVQSPEKSGSLITTKWAVQYNRDVFAIPGDVDVRQSMGPNRLIRSGAKLVESAMDVLEEYGYIFANHKPAEPAVPDPVAENDQQQAIIDVLMNGDADMTELSLKTKIELSNIILLLTDLQIRGIITEKPGGSYALSKTFTI